MNSSQGPLRTGMGLFGWLLVLPMLAAIIWYPYNHGDYVNASLAAAFSVGAILGHRMGAAKIIGFFIGGAIGSYYSVPLGKECEPMVRSLLQQEGMICELASQGVVVIGATFLTVLVFQIVVGVCSVACPSLQIANQRLGFVLGSAQAVGMAIIFICGILVIEPFAAKRLQATAKQETKDTNDISHTVCEKVVEIVACPVVRPSPLGQCLEKLNPFERIESLKKLRQGFELFSDPATLEKMVKSPEFGNLAARPDLREALTELSANPQIKQMMTTGQGLDPQSVANLMSNPAVIKLMNDPQVMAEIMKQSH